MVQEEKVRKVYNDLKELRDVLKRNRENPHVIRIVDNLLTLTNLGEDVEQSKGPETDELGPELVTAAPKKPVGPCEHKLTDVYGRCTGCGECQHSVYKNGYCVTCGENEDDKSEGEKSA